MAFGPFRFHDYKGSLCLTLVLPLLTAVLALPLHGGSPDGHQVLLGAAESFLRGKLQPLGEEIHIELEPPRAQLPPCVDPRPFLAAGTTLPRPRVTIGIHCQGDRQVRYVPARLKVVGTYLVTTRNLPAGSTLDAGSFSLERGDLATLPGNVLRTPDTAEGKVVRHRLAAGTPLLTQHLVEIPLVGRGERVVVQSSGMGFVVNREGEALESGALGDRVRVQLDRRTVIDARVSARGRVTVTP